MRFISILPTSGGLQVAAWAALALCALFKSTSAQLPEALRRSVVAAKIHYPALQPIKYWVDAARAEKITAALRPNPAFNLQELLTLRRRDQNPDFGYFSGAQRQDWLQFTKELNVFGQRKRRIDVAERQISAAQVEIELAENEAMFVAGMLWLEALDLHWQSRLLERALQNMDSVVQINEVRLRNLVVTAIEVERTLVSRRDFANRLAFVRAELENVKGALRVFTGPNAVFEFPDVPPAPPVPLDAANLDSLAQGVYELHPMLKAARAERETAVADLALQRALAKPVLEAGFIINPQNAVPYAGLYFNVPIPVFDRNQGNIAGADVRIRQAESEIESRGKIFAAELARLAGAMRLKRQNLDLARELVQQNEKIIAAIRYGYLKGGTTLIDYLGAQDVWFDSIEKYNQAGVAYLKDYFDFYYQSGILTTLE